MMGTATTSCCFRFELYHRLFTSRLETDSSVTDVLVVNMGGTDQADWPS